MSIPEMRDIIGRLEKAYATHDADGVERAMRDGFGIGMTMEFLPILVALLGEPWHSCHEDIVGCLQDLRAPDAVEALHEAAFARHKYLAYDGNFGLARKCAWALADIGSERARAALEQIAASDNAIVAAHARRRLDRWTEEEGRKRS